MNSQLRDQPDACQRAWDEISIVKTVSKLACAQDDRDFAAYESCFTETIIIDQPMIAGWKPTKMLASEWTRIGLTRLSGFDVTHHRLFNHIIDVQGDDATCVVDLSALHIINEEHATSSWSVGGRYHLRLRRVSGQWLISERALKVRYQMGDMSLLEKATNRALARAAAHQ